MTEGKAVLLTLIAYGITLLVIGVICQRRTRDGEKLFGGNTVLVRLTTQLRRNDRIDKIRWLRESGEFGPYP